MNWMDKLEKKWGRYAVSNLSAYFVIATVIGQLISLVAPVLMLYISFDMNGVIHGQIWRLVTWIFMPVSSLDFFGILFLVCALLWGRSLENIFGTFRLNLYFVMGILVCDLGGILIYVISRLFLGQGLPVDLSSYYMLTTMLLMMAAYMPDHVILISFVLPVKMKWWLLFELLYMGWQMLQMFTFRIEQCRDSGSAGVAVGVILGFVDSAPMILALLNMGLFFHFANIHISRKHKKRQKEFRAQFREPRPGSGIAKHKCVVCGRTELTNPEMMFRYCSKCSGNREYCEEHLYSHVHVK